MDRWTTHRLLPLSLSVLCVSFVSIATHTLYPPCIAGLSGCRCRHIRQYAPSITDHVSVLSLCALHVPSVQAILMIYCYCSFCYCSLCYWCSVCLLLYTHRLYSPCIGALFLTQPCSILVPSLASSWFSLLLSLSLPPSLSLLQTPSLIHTYALSFFLHIQWQRRSMTVTRKPLMWIGGQSKDHCRLCR